MKRSDFLERVEAARRSLHHKYLCAIVSTAVFLAFAIYLTFASESFQRNYLYPFPYRDAVETYADRYRVDPYLAIAVIKTESKFQDDVHSHRGAIGLMQLMPGTASSIGVDPYDPLGNILGGTIYLRNQLDNFAGWGEYAVTDAVAAYNAGPQAVYDYSGVPPYSETRNYVVSVADAYNNLLYASQY